MKFLTFTAASILGAAFKARVSSQQHTAECRTNAVLDTKFKPLALGEVINLAEDVAIFRFLLPRVDDTFDLVPCSTLQACLKEGANIVDQPMRSYTPITPNGTMGYFDLLVKKQPRGRFTEHLFSMNVGDTLLFRVVQYKLQYKKNRWAEVGLIGGGTGICPLLQFMNASLDTPGDKTKLSLLFANRSENKILLKGMLDGTAKKHADRLSVHYTVDMLENPQSDYNGYIGYITPQMIKETMPEPADNNLVLVCGPDPMMTKVVGSSPNVLKAMSGGLAYQPTGTVLNNAPDVGGILGDMGYTKDHVYRF
ncbi:NADH-cytochrome b5 reductase, putative [Trypanosoma equiperdum]|uniref:NADH-cytochrome b5 reductase n=3 Tax=Trypanozoon TaxID=39700 RepID=Q381N0_TRYB2|nr:NADH-cytochrome b5 reductase,putative [Trypanosoma brucei gambiense DAL972]XP_829613.1 NADH-cytochrome b5 reductase, putative [Trypanosoma brucei brucei TREU927]EAN80501.1 NADH-cytochrome b5 reductase, putative [Trypanosoma brucei brucei TREU927]CBH18625.1 NADH-cytochrome b5 reductase,putative [Trypanosoma brucei gambiense DAL972]SCU70174.1 NADH-cytochrome b5 reductase, putative [Trypanosoma equiperdum]|eukprot:XP_011780889.1 NADH-cytochrome b5 reductase,putative [Trypanosoma brucei gambiense DAL972]